jgi:hypothetical protein
VNRALPINEGVDKLEKRGISVETELLKTAWSAREREREREREGAHLAFAGTLDSS